MRFYQGDSRWGNLPYPKGDTVADSGCGLCSCTTVLNNIEKYKKYDPRQFRKYMVDSGFAVAGQGTTWNGITQTLKHYGYSSVLVPDISASMSSAWKELNKGNKAGVLLFSAGSRGGVTWTTGGHYVAFDSYKVENGKHYFLTRDSGYRNHTGWYCYETTMKGLLPMMWIVTKPTKKPYGGKYPTKTIKSKNVGENVYYWQKYLNWYGYKFETGTLKKARFGTNTLKYTKAFQKANGLVVDGIVGTKTIAKAKTIKK